MKYLFYLFVLIANMQFAIAQSKSLAAEAAATAMTTLWKESFSVDAGKPVKWTYNQSLVLHGIERLWIQTANPEYFSFLQKSMELYKAQDYNRHNVLFGRILLTLYNVTGQVQYYKAASLLRDQLKGQMLAKEGKLYMVQPFYAAYAKQFHEPEAFDEIANQFIWMEKHARDAKSGIAGSYEMALVDVLENFPAMHPKRDTLIAILKRVADAINKAQNPLTGLWYDALNMPEQNENDLECNASAMFVCAIAKAVRLGLLPTRYLVVSTKGYNGIVKQYIKKEGKGSANLKESLIADSKGIGAFIQAANEME
jgi:unsaturated rhamnogalacturonyl hydrolase